VNSIRARLTFALIAAGAVLLVLLCVTAYSRARALLVAQFDDSLQARAIAMVSLLQWESKGIELEYKDEYMPEFERPKSGFYFEVWSDVNGAWRTIERSHSLKAHDLPMFSGKAIAPAFRSFEGHDGRPLRGVGIRASSYEDEDDKRSASERAGAEQVAIVVVAGDTTTMEKRLRTFAFELLAAGALGLAALALLTRLVLRRGLLPLAGVSAHAARIDASTLGERFPVTGLPAELSPICARLNDLLARVDAAFTRERQFNADVAHELRTPIAELRTLSEVGADLASSGKGDPETNAFFRDAGDIARRMEGTVTTLLVLARCESGTQTIELTKVGIAEVVAPLQTVVEAEARPRNLDVQVSVPTDISVQSDRDLLGRLLRILLENAVEYTPLNGSISVSAKANEIVVSNGPVALDASDIPNLFDRFWRKDRARTDDRHAGLGLALAKEIARLLRLDLVPNLQSNKTFTMTVKW
jgi:two-component system sensor histidine kinase QseC